MEELSEEIVIGGREVMKRGGVIALSDPKGNILF